MSADGWSWAWAWGLVREEVGMDCVMDVDVAALWLWS